MSNALIIGMGKPKLHSPDHSDDAPDSEDGNGEGEGGDGMDKKSVARDLMDALKADDVDAVTEALSQFCEMHADEY
jgi:hypothetical protein